MSDAKLWGEPFSIGGAEWHLVGGRCDLVPIDIETTREQRAALGYEEAAHDVVLPLALAAGASVGHPLLASADYGEPLRVTLLHGAPSLSPIPETLTSTGSSRARRRSSPGWRPISSTPTSRTSAPATSLSIVCRR